MDDKINWRDLHIEQGKLLQLKRHIESLHPHLKKETIEDIDLCLTGKLKAIEFQIKHYPK